MKYVGIVNDSGSSIDFKFGRNSSQQLLRWNAFAAGSSAFVLPFLVFRATEKMSVLGNTGTMTVEAHGYLLDDT